MGWIWCIRWEKSRPDFVAQTFALIAPVHRICTKFHAVTKQSQMHPNTMQHTKTRIYGPMGRIGCARCKKSRRDFVAQTLALIARVDPVFASSFIQLGNDPKCTQSLCDAPKHEFRVQWSGLGAFIAKNPDVTSWHVLLHQFTLFCTEFHAVTKRSQMHPNTMQLTKICV